ncbi:UNVERIFIED_CONTAM: hypothetical protein GTU68_030062 [Idotea baltica]|nr:hypothetical protein [Idotea baltica]
MFAVIKTGGKQYKVAVNDVIRVEKLAGEAGETINFEDVLMHGADGNATVGTPMVSGAVVTGEILEQFRDKKVIAFKKRRRKHSSMTKKGHRQYLTAKKVREAAEAEKLKGAEESLMSADDVDTSAPAAAAPAADDGDDLTKLPGLGEASQAQFNEMGVYYYSQFDGWGPADWDYVEAYVETQLNGRVDVDRASIMVQIKKLLEG